MGFAPFIGNSGSSLSGLAVKNENRKQALIDQGTQMINAVYDGGTVPSYMKAAGTYDPATQYFTYSPKGGYAQYNAKGTPVPGGSGNTAGGSPNNTAGNVGLGVLGGPALGLAGIFGEGSTPQALNFMKSGKLFTAGPSKTYSGFSPQFFADRAGAYEQYALPQLGQQYNDASKSIDYGLADRGLYDSSAGNTARSALTRTNASQVQNVADEGRAQSQQLQTSVANAKQAALQQLYSTADPQGAGESALSSAASLQVPSAFAPVGQAFADLASQYSINSQLSQYNQPVYYNTQQGYGSSPVNAGALPTQ